MARLNSRARARRVPYVPQMEAAECGVACLAMVLRYHGAAHSLSELRGVCEVGRDGVSAAKIYRGAAHYGLLVDALRLEPEQLARQALPAIVHWEFNHFVVVSRFLRDHVLIVDPAVGERRVTHAEFSASFTGVTLTLARGPTFRRATLQSESSRRVLAVMQSFWAGGSALLVSVLLLELLGLLLPAANQVLVDHVLMPSRESWLWPLLGAVAGCSFSALVVGALRDRLLRRLYFAADVELAASFVERILQLPLSFFELRTSGDLIQRVEAQRAVRDLILRGVTAALDGVLLLGYGALMLAYDLRVGGLVIILSALHACLVLRTQPAVAQACAAELAAQGREAQVVVESLSAPELVRAFGAEELLAQRQEERCVARLSAEVAQRVTSERALQLSGALDSLAHALVIGLGGLEVLADRMTLGVFAGLLTLQALFQKPLRSLLESVASLGRMRAVFERLDDVFTERAEPSGALRVALPRGELALARVSFRYPGQARSLCDRLELLVRPGEKVALVGRSGSGKSTLLRLLAGLFAPSEGAVRLDGVALAELSPSWLGQQLGVVLQEPMLVDDTVRANITLGVPDASAEDVYEAARIACIDERIRALHDGYETKLGAGGVRLSGGERQRLALARALVRRPRVLLLDEATSSLDPATEARVHEQLGRLGCTRVIVAHRLATVRDADRILVIEGGQIVQQGRYDALAEAPGLFRELVASDCARRT